MGLAKNIDRQADWLSMSIIAWVWHFRWTFNSAARLWIVSHTGSYLLTFSLSSLFEIWQSFKSDFQMLCFSDGLLAVCLNVFYKRTVRGAIRHKKSTWTGLKLTWLIPCANLPLRSLSGRAFPSLILKILLKHVTEQLIHGNTLRRGCTQLDMQWYVIIASIILAALTGCAAWQPSIFYRKHILENALPTRRN